MTDEEILKAFECCCGDDVNGTHCKDCPAEKYNFDWCSDEVLREMVVYIKRLKAENAELKEKAQKLDEQLKAISDRTAKFPSLEQIEKRFLDWAIPFLKANVTSCKEEWFGIEWIAKAIWEFIKNGFENAIAVDETNAALRGRLEKAVELPCKVGDKVYIPWVWDNQSGIMEAPVVTIRLYPYVRKYEIRLETDSLTFAQKYQYGNFNDKDFGTLIFTTPEAAEARLKQMQGGEE